MSKNIQMKHRIQGSWEDLYPKTKGSLVEVGNTTVDKKVSDIEGDLNSKANVVDVYTKQQVDSKLDENANGVPISTEEPTEGNLWFEEI